MKESFWGRLKKAMKHLNDPNSGVDKYVMIGGVFWTLCCFLTPGGIFALWFSGFLGGILLFIAFCFLYFFVVFEEKSINNRDDQNNKEKEELLRKMSDGSWDFPSFEFVEQCLYEGFDDCVTNITEMQEIAKEILSEKGVPAEYHSKYCSKTKIKKYFDENYYSPQKTKPSNIKIYGMINCVEGVKVTEGFLYSLKFLQGKAKREYMLKYFLGCLSKEHASYLKSMANFNTHYHKAKASNINPAIAGGLASAIGGVGAGVYAAGKMMEENWKSEQQANTCSTLAAFSGQQAAYAKYAVEKFEKELNALKRKKIYDEYSTEDIFRELKIKTSFTLEKRGIYLHIYINSRGNDGISDDVFPGVVDGSFSAYVYVKRKLVYEYVIPFGIFGHKSGLLGNDLDYDVKWSRGMYVIPITFLGKNREKDIKIQIKPNNLWIMSE